MDIHIKLSDSFQPKSQLFEGWQRAWDVDLPKGDIHWLRHDFDRGLFRKLEHYKKRGPAGEILPRHVLKDDRMWFYPPEPKVFVENTPPIANAFFHGRVFFWRPLGVWRYSFRCPRKNCPGKDSDNTFLTRSGYSGTVRYICDIEDWYCMLTEVLSCKACMKAAKGSQDHHVGRFKAWDWSIVSQLPSAHQELFPAVLTYMRGVDKKVVNLLRGRSEGNTMSKVQRQIKENHCEAYLKKKHLYTTLLMALKKKGGIVSMLQHKFQEPPPRRELPSAKLLRKAWLLSEERLAAKNATDQAQELLRTKAQSISLDSLPPAKELPEERPRTARPQMTYPVVPNLAGTSLLKVRRDLFGELSSTDTSVSAAGPSTVSISSAVPVPSTYSGPSTSTGPSTYTGPSTSIYPGPSTSFVRVPISAFPGRGLYPSAVRCPMSGFPGPVSSPAACAMSASTMYKRRKLDDSASSSTQRFTTKLCKLCGQSTQSHQKYKKKTFCPKTKKSTSERLKDRTFTTFEEFKLSVDDLK